MLPKPKRTTNKKLIAQIKTLRCCICGAMPSDPSHIKTRGSGGPDLGFNVVPKCRDHHREWGRIGWKKFVERYPAFGMKLVSMGWVLDDELLGLWHPELQRGVE